MFALFILMGALLAANNTAIYTSANLGGHTVFAECLADDTVCDSCSDLDVQVQSFASHGTCTANPQQRNIFVNAICFTKFQDQLPNGDPITASAYHYSVEFQLPLVAIQDVNAPAVGEFVHLMVQLWGGASNLTGRPQHTQEATVLIGLNPWNMPGDVKVYERDLELKSTGLQLPPDTSWHQVDIYVDFAVGKFSIAIDGTHSGPYDLAYVHQPTWNAEEVSLAITTESENAFPGETCSRAFSWTTKFRNVAFSDLEANLPSIFSDGFESGDVNKWSTSVP